MQTTNIGTQKIDDTTFGTYEMIIAAFLITDQADRLRFFEEIFLRANVSPDVVLRMRFFTLSDADIDFPKRKLQWKSYTIKKTLSTIKQVKLVRKKEFVVAVLDLGYESFIVYVASLENPSND